MSDCLRWDEQDSGEFERNDGLVVFPSAAEPGNWMVADPGFDRFTGRCFGTAEAAMQAVDAADAAKHRSVFAYTDDNPKTAYGDKKPPLHLVPPALIIGAGGVFKLGAHKYGPYNWREKRVSSSVYQGAALRHLLAWWDGEENDPESGESHLAHAAACVGILLDAQAVGNLNDNRPVAGTAADLIREREEKT